VLVRASGGGRERGGNASVDVLAIDGGVAIDGQDRRHDRQRAIARSLDERVRHAVRALGVARRHRERVLDGRHGLRHHREDLEEQRPHLHPAQQRRILHFECTAAGQRTVALARCAGLHQLACVPVLARLDAQTRRSGTLGQSDLEPDLLGLRRWPKQ
jgi:hypothetical protein